MTKKMKMSLLLAKLFIIFVLALPLLSCGSSGSGGVGGLTVSIIDDPLDWATSLNVGLTFIEVRGNGEPKVLTINPDLAQPVDLLELENGIFATLVDGNDNLNKLPAGSYSNVKIGISSATVTFTDNPDEVPTPATLPPGKFNISGPFTIAENQITEIILVFNVHNALHIAGNGKYTLNPSLKIMERNVSGWISGSVLPAPGLDTGGNTLKAKVSANQGTEDEAATFAADDGTFELNPLREGNHDINVEWLTMNDINGDGVLDIIDCKKEGVGNFSVTAGQATDIGSIALTGSATSCL